MNRHWKNYDRASWKSLSLTEPQRSGSVRRCTSENSVPVLIQDSESVSGGFATIHPGNSLTVNAVEGAPLEDFSVEVR